MNLPYAYAKVCSKCGELKIVCPINYAKHSSAKYGVMPMCKVCKAKYEKERRAKKKGKQEDDDTTLWTLVNPDKLLEFMEHLKGNEHKIQPLQGRTVMGNMFLVGQERIGLRRALFGKDTSYKVADVDIDDNGNEAYIPVDPKNLMDSFVGAFDAPYSDPENPINEEKSVCVIYTKHHLVFVQLWKDVVNDKIIEELRTMMFVCDYSVENEQRLAELIVNSPEIETVILLDYTTGIFPNKQRYYSLEVIPRIFEYISIFNPETDELVETFPSIAKACKHLKLNYKNDKKAIQRALAEESKKFNYIWRMTDEDGSY